MKVYCLIVLLFLGYSSCQRNNDLPEDIKGTNLESVYPDIKWELYKSALYCSGRTDYNIVTKQKSVLVENLTELNLSLDTIIMNNSDKLSLIHFFKLGNDLVIPTCRNVANSTFIYKITYDNIGKTLTEYSTGGVTFTVSDINLDELVGVSDEEFINELRKRDKIDKWLKSEIKRRGYTL